MMEEDMPNTRMLITQYQEGLAFQQQRLQEMSYELGRLDERIGDAE